MAEYTSKFSGEEIDEILDKAKAADDSNYGLSGYLTREEAEQKISDSVPTKLSELENDKGYLLEENAESQTDTIVLSYEDRVVVESYYIDPGETATIIIEDDDVAYVVDASNIVVAEWDGGTGGFASYGQASFEVNVAAYSDEYTSIDIWHDENETVAVTVKRVKYGKSIVANIAENSIGYDHLNSDIKEKITKTYTKDEIDNKIENVDPYIGFETETIKTYVGNSYDIETHNLASGTELVIHPENEYLQYIIEFENTPNSYDDPVKIYCVDGFWMPVFANPCSITLSNYDANGGIDRIVIMDGSPNTVNITKTKNDKAIIADVKEMSIGLKHLKDEVIDEFSSSDATYSCGDTETVSMSVSNTRTYIADAGVRVQVTIPINSDDTKVKINNTTTGTIECIFIYCGDESFLHGGNTTDEIDLTQYDNPTELMVCFTSTGIPYDGETLEAIITSSQSTISADVKEGSIRPEHLAEEYYTKEEVTREIEDVEAIAKGRATGYVFDTVEDLDTWLSDEENIATLVLGDNFYIRAVDVPDYWWDGSEKQQLETQKVDLTEYVKNTDYATKDVAGVVKVQNYSKGLYVDGNGELRVYCAENSEVRGLGTDKPLGVRSLGLGVSLYTHQDMSEDYDISTLKVSGYTPGIQNKLPVSYEAAKNYIDGITGDIGTALDNIIALQGQY